MFGYTEFTKNSNVSYEFAKIMRNLSSPWIVSENYVQKTIQV